MPAAAQQLMLLLPNGERPFIPWPSLLTLLEKIIAIIHQDECGLNCRETDYFAQKIMDYMLNKEPCFNPNTHHFTLCETPKFKRIISLIQQAITDHTVGQIPGSLASAGEARQWLQLYDGFNSTDNTFSGPLKRWYTLFVPAFNNAMQKMVAATEEAQVSMENVADIAYIIFLVFMVGYFLSALLFQNNHNKAFYRVTSTGAMAAFSLLTVGITDFHRYTHISFSCFMIIFMLLHQLKLPYQIIRPLILLAFLVFAEQQLERIYSPNATFFKQLLYFMCMSTGMTFGDLAALLHDKLSILLV